MSGIFATNKITYSKKARMLLPSRLILITFISNAPVLRSVFKKFFKIQSDKVSSFLSDRENHCGVNCILRVHLLTYDKTILWSSMKDNLWISFITKHDIFEFLVSFGIFFFKWIIFTIRFPYRTKNLLHKSIFSDIRILQ